MAAGMRASSITTGLVAAEGRAAIRPKTAASINIVVESASHSNLRLLPKNGGRSDRAMAARVRLKAAEWATAPTTRRNDEKVRSNLGARVIMALCPLGLWLDRRIGQPASFSTIQYTLYNTIIQVRSFLILLSY